MKVVKVELKNGYKRFDHLTIDLGEKPARVVALVGPNGCGKSSVLDGMLFCGSRHQSLGEKGARDWRYHSMTGIENSATDVAIQFDRGSMPQVVEAKRQLGKPGTIFSFRSCYRYNNSVKITEARA